MYSVEILEIQNSQLFSFFLSCCCVCLFSLLAEKELEEFEIAALGNLCPETAEEARSLIPSLAKRFDDSELQTILNDLASLRRFE